MQILIIGYGNVGRAIADALVEVKSYEIHVYSRRLIKKNSKIKFYNHDLPQVLSLLKKDSVIFVAVQESQWVNLAPTLASFQSRLNIVSLSGSLYKNELNDLGILKVSFFHPLFPFTKNVRTSFQDIPIGIEAHNRALQKMLEGLAKKMGARVFDLPKNRMLYHAAAVVSAAGIVATFSLAQRLLQKSGISKKSALIILQKISTQSLVNAQTLTFDKALTGPIVRRDFKTLKKHFAALNEENLGDELKLYQALIQFMTKKYRAS